MQEQNTSTTAYVAGIDGLRAIAVLSVVVFHLNHTLLPGGFSGVDVFFVISGYVISKSLASSDASNFRIYLLGFYRRRLIRILPALIVCLLLSGVAASMFVASGWLGRSNNFTGLWAFLGLSNFYLVFAADGYFNDGIPFNPFVHTWSLAVEEQFYLLFPPIFYLWLKSGGWGAGSKIKIKMLLVVLAFASLAFSVYQTRSNSLFAFYLLPSRFWELAAGAILFQLHSNNMMLVNTFTQVRCAMFLGFILIGLGFIYAVETAFPFPWALLPVSGTCLIITATIGRPSEALILQQFLQSRVMVYVGRLSYSLYLWHWPIFSLFRWTVGLSQAANVVAALLLTFCMSMLSYHFVEKPVRANLYLRKQSDWRIVLGGIGVVSIALITTAAIFKYDKVIGLNQSVTADSCAWNAWQIDGCSDVEIVPSALAPQGKQIFAIGDSHAGAYTAMLRQVEKVTDTKVYIFGSAGCGVARLSEPNAAMPQCANRFLETAIEMSKPGDIVFLASLRVNRLGNHFRAFDNQEIVASVSDTSAEEQRKRGFEEAVRIVRRLQSRGLYVLFDAPKPMFRAPLYRCADWFNQSNPVCKPGFSESRSFLLRHRQAAMEALARLRDSYDVFVWDPFPILCDTDDCKAFTDDGPLFNDGDHISGFANRLLVPDFLKKLEEIWASEEKRRVGFLL